MVDLDFVFIYVERQRHFSGRRRSCPNGSGRDKKLRIYVGTDQCEIIAKRRYNGSEACDPLCSGIQDSIDRQSDAINMRQKRRKPSGGPGFRGK